MGINLLAECMEYVCEGHKTPHSSTTLSVFLRAFRSNIAEELFRFDDFNNVRGRKGVCNGLYEKKQNYL